MAETAVWIGRDRPVGAGRRLGRAGSGWHVFTGPAKQAGAGPSRRGARAIGCQEWRIGYYQLGVPPSSSLPPSGSGSGSNISMASGSGATVGSSVPSGSSGARLGAGLGAAAFLGLAAAFLATALRFGFAAAFLGFFACERSGFRLRAGA